ncbi:MAG: hypothetical protein FJ197_03935 [Gammaproteobacteria bacterium]|nr:hypothetical protein [Gammaproteobacteria bacterium]
MNRAVATSAWFLCIHPDGPNGFNQAVLYRFEGYVHTRTGKGIDDFPASAPRGSDRNFDRIGAQLLNYCSANSSKTVADDIIDLWNRINAGQ